MFADLLAQLIDHIAINQTTTIEGYLFKRRKRGRSWIIIFGNIFLKLSNSKILMFPSTKAWQKHEYKSYLCLYGGGCEIVDGDTLRIHPFEGQSIRDYLQEDAITTAMMTAFSHELRRVHQLDNWSHGDLHTHNVLWDGQRIRFIDFETYHQRAMTIHERHADDLLVFLLDFMGRCSSDNWLSHCQTLIASYNDHEVLQHLQDRLYMPRGLELVLWKTRTNYLPNHSLADRLNTLQQWIDNLLVA